jgi:nucleoside-diphosphate-sugar epimerase
MNMKALFVGGTGLISMAITEKLAKDPTWELTLLNRGNQQSEVPSGVKTIIGDINNNETEISKALEGLEFDVVADFIGFMPAQIERDIRLFKGKTKQYIYISSAAGYLTPPSNHVITEGVLQKNPYWQYARDKINSEIVLWEEYKKSGFPITIVRPSHTYSKISIPFCLDTDTGCWPVIDRMLKGKPIIIPGDGSSLWTVTFNTDFAKGFIGLMGNKHALGEAVHITTDESLTWNQIHETVADILGVRRNFYYISTDFLIAAKPSLEGPLNGDKRHSIFYDNTKIKRLVPDYCATVRFDQGARIALEHILSTPKLQKPDPDFDIWCDKLISAMDKALVSVKQV